MICSMCGKEHTPGKVKFNEHHISYKTNKTVTLCFVCHCIMHCRLKFHNPYNKYGVDYAAVYMARDILRIYEPVLEEIDTYKYGGNPYKKKYKKTRKKKA